ncbi:MAG: hypothetical protein ACE5ER_09745 [Nitrospinaceae bacterium]
MLRRAQHDNLRVPLTPAVTLSLGKGDQRKKFMLRQDQHGNRN